MTCRHKEKNDTGVLKQEKRALANKAWHLYQTNIECANMIRNMFSKEFDAIEEAIQAVKEEPVPF